MNEEETIVGQKIYYSKRLLSRDWKSFNVLSYILGESQKRKHRNVKINTK